MGADDTESDFFSKRPVRDTDDSTRSLNTFTALDPVSPPIYFADPQNPWILPAPAVSSYPTASVPDATGDAVAPGQSTQSPRAVSGSPTPSPSWTAKDTTSHLQPPRPTLIVNYPSIGPLSTVLSTLPYSSRSLSPSTIMGPPTIAPSPTAAKIEPTSVLPAIPYFPVAPSVLTNFKWPIVTTTQPASDGHSFSGYGETMTPSRHMKLPSGAEQLLKGDDVSDQNLSPYFETSIPKIQINIEFSSEESGVTEDLLLDKLHTFFLELLVSGPKSASFATADLLVVVVSSAPTEVLLTGKMFYERTDRPTTHDITAQLQAYFSLWGTAQLSKYLRSDNFLVDRVWIQLNDVPISSQAGEEESEEIATLSIVLSVLLIMVALAMFAFGVFMCRHFRQTTGVQIKQEATPSEESKQTSYPTNMVMASSRTLTSVSKYKEDDCESETHCPPSRSRQCSVGGESKSTEEQYGRCSHF